MAALLFLWLAHARLSLRPDCERDAPPSSLAEISPNLPLELEGPSHAEVLTTVTISQFSSGWTGDDGALTDGDPRTKWTTTNIPALLEFDFQAFHRIEEVEIENDAPDGADRVDVYVWSKAGDASFGRWLWVGAAQMEAGDTKRLKIIPVLTGKIRLEFLTYHMLGVSVKNVNFRGVSMWIMWDSPTPRRDLVPLPSASEEEVDTSCPLLNEYPTPSYSDLATWALAEMGKPGKHTTGGCMCAVVLPPNAESGGSVLGGRTGVTPTKKRPMSPLNWTRFGLPPEIKKLIEILYSGLDHAKNPQLSQLWHDPGNGQNVTIKEDSKVAPLTPTYTKRNPHPETDASYATPFNEYNGRVVSLKPQDPLEAVQSPNFGPHGSLIMLAKKEESLLSQDGDGDDKDVVQVRIGCGAMACLARQLAKLQFRGSSCFGVLQPICERLLSQSGCGDIVPNACDGGALDTCVRGTLAQLAGP